jgi:Mg/Co/Ni transporter MgtE
VEAVRERVAASPYPFAVVLSETDVVLGRVSLKGLERAVSASLADAMEPGPSTVRPHTSARELAERLAKRDLRFAIVTDPEGRFIGVARREELERA